MEKREPLYTVSGSSDWCSHSREVPQKLKIELSDDPAIPFPGIYLEKMKTLIQKKSYMDPNVNSNTIFKVMEDMEATQVPTNR